MMKIQAVQRALNLTIHKDPVLFQVLDIVEFPQYSRHLIEYAGNEADPVSAFLFLPKHSVPCAAVLVHHQHHGQRHLGKSEVCGIAGDRWQAFCPVLAEMGVVVLAPDSICFEDRRKNQQGIDPDPDPDRDFLQHYNEMCYRLLRGDTLMRKVVEDSSIAVSILYHHAQVDREKIGILGHSYGGNTVLFHAPFDDRIAFACSSGAACSFRHKIAQGTGIEMAEVLPGFAQHYDIEDLIAGTAPRKMLVLSGTTDKYSKDAEDLVSRAGRAYQKAEVPHHLSHKSFNGGHALNEDRFNVILAWLSEQAGKTKQPNSGN